MSTITAEQAKNFTKDLSILYVEDDIKLQTQTKKFFDIMFHSVVVANNGEEALDSYSNKKFDIVISDIKMPIMDGVTLSSKIRAINPNQCIIIISAFDDSEYLVKFINLNIKQFIKKPTNMQNMLETLYATSKNIVNEGMVEDYRKELEHSNKDLLSKNDELNSLIRILDSKLIQKGNKKELQSTGIDMQSAILSQANFDELKELEIDISGASVLISLSRNLNISNIQVLGSMFLEYSKILVHYKAYDILSTTINELGNSLNNAPENFIKRVEDISTLLESFIYVLRMWRNNLVKGEVHKAFDLHTSMVNDISTIVSIVNGTEDDIETQMEFF